jgi:hypothetical protein
MYRKVFEYLKAWKESKYRKPLVLQGARQVGKTYAVLEFGRKEYDNVAYFNFQTSSALEKTFDEDITPAYLIPILSHISGQTITKGHTLIVFDEVQLCERAVTSLKYFCEEAPEYHLIAAGSFLGVAVNREKYAFPVGKVDRYTMHPMDMEEFLLAMNEGELVERIRKCNADNAPMPAALHESVLKLWRQYLAVGGMTENYVNTQLVSSGFKPYYWRNEKGTKEIDFIISINGKLIPVEVKSGEHVDSKSLSEYVRLFKPAYSVRISAKNFGFENGIKSVPLYAAFCIQPEP